jgi:hypothetical protein
MQSVVDPTASFQVATVVATLFPDPASTVPNGIAVSPVDFAPEPDAVAMAAAALLALVVRARARRVRDPRATGPAGTGVRLC